MGKQRPPKKDDATRRVGLDGLRQAFDEVRFGAERILNLRETLPTGDEAARRVELWLRQQQVDKAGEVLVITGRGNASHDGVSVVREAVIRTFHQLKRKGVVAEHAEHTPGSFVVTLAKLSQLVEAPARRRHPEDAPKPASPPSLESLEPPTRKLLRDLAERALESLGVFEKGTFLEGEMLRQFGAIAATVPPGPDREVRLRQAIRLAMEDYE